MSRFIALPILPVAVLLWFLVPAQAAPIPRAQGVILHLDQGDFEAGVSPIGIAFNPKEYTIDKPVPWKKGQAHEDVPRIEFSTAEGRVMTFELFFDLYEEGPQPREVAAAIEGLVGKPVPITWGNRLWTGTLKASKPGTSPTMKKGNSVRLTLDTTWSDFTPVDPLPEYPFTVDIPGAPEAATMIREVSIDPLALPPDPNGERGHARFVIASPQGLNPDLLKWQRDWDTGVQTRRTLTVTIFDERKSLLQSVELDASGPIRYAIGDPNEAMAHATLEVTVLGVRIDSPFSDNPVPEPPPLAGELQRQDPLPFFGFTVKITGALGTANAFFKSVGGLKTETEVTDYQEGGITGFTRKLVGVTKWPNLTLVGRPKDPKPLFLRWVSDAAQGKPWPARIEIAPLYLLDGKPYRTRALILEDVVPDRYVFPELSGIWSEGDVTERISLPPLYGVVK